MRLGVHAHISQQATPELLFRSDGTTIWPILLVLTDGSSEKHGAAFLRSRPDGLLILRQMALVTQDPHENAWNLANHIQAIYPSEFWNRIIVHSGNEFDLESFGGNPTEADFARVRDYGLAFNAAIRRLVPGIKCASIPSSPGHNEDGPDTIFGYLIMAPYLADCDYVLAHQYLKRTGYDGDLWTTIRILRPKGYKGPQDPGGLLAMLKSMGIDKPVIISECNIEDVNSTDCDVDDAVRAFVDEFTGWPQIIGMVWFVDASPDQSFYTMQLQLSRAIRRTWSDLSVLYESPTNPPEHEPEPNGGITVPNYEPIIEKLLIAQEAMNAAKVIIQRRAPKAAAIVDPLFASNLDRIGSAVNDLRALPQH